jgi:hypothetical protein
VLSSYSFYYLIYRSLNILRAYTGNHGNFGFDRTAHGNKRSSATARKWKWLHELEEEREKDIRTEVFSH